MDAAISTVSAPQPAPVPQADLRPTADAAAVARNPSPTLSMAIPASMGQSGAVNASRMTETVTPKSEAVPTERVLKPYGVAMLPERASPPAQEAATEADPQDEVGSAEG